MISGPIRIVTGMCFLQRKQQSRITVLPVSGIAVLFRFCCKYRIFSGDSKILANSLTVLPVSGIAVLFRFCCKYRIFSGDSKILANSLRLAESTSKCNTR